MSVRREKENDTHYKLATWSVVGKSYTHILEQEKGKKERMRGVCAGKHTLTTVHTLHTRREGGKSVHRMRLTMIRDSRVKWEGLDSHIVWQAIICQFCNTKISHLSSLLLWFPFTSIAPFGTTVDGRHITSPIGFQWTPTTTSCQCIHR